MDLQNIRVDRAAGHTEYMGETLNFKYRPALITPKTYNKLSEATSVDDLTEFYRELLVSWDLTRAGEKLEVTQEVIAELPMQLLRGIAEFIMKEVPQRDSGKD